VALAERRVKAAKQAAAVVPKPFRLHQLAQLNQAGAMSLTYSLVAVVPPMAKVYALSAKYHSVIVRLLGTSGSTDHHLIMMVKTRGGCGLVSLAAQLVKRVITTLLSVSDSGEVRAAWAHFLMSHAMLDSRGRSNALRPAERSDGVDDQDAEQSELLASRNYVDLLATAAALPADEWTKTLTGEQMQRLPAQPENLFAMISTVLRSCALHDKTGRQAAAEAIADEQLLALRSTGLTRAALSARGVTLDAREIRALSVSGATHVTDMFEIRAEVQCDRCPSVMPAGGDDESVRLELQVDSVSQELFLVVRGPSRVLAEAVESAQAAMAETQDDAGREEARHNLWPRERLVIVKVSGARDLCRECDEYHDVHAYATDSPYRVAARDAALILRDAERSIAPVLRRIACTRSLFLGLLVDAQLVVVTRHGIRPTPQLLSAVAIACRPRVPLTPWVPVRELLLEPAPAGRKSLWQWMGDATERRPDRDLARIVPRNWFSTGLNTDMTSVNLQLTTHRRLVVSGSAQESLTGAVVALPTPDWAQLLLPPQLSGKRDANTPVPVRKAGTPASSVAALVFTAAAKAEPVSAGVVRLVSAVPSARNDRAAKLLGAVVGDWIGQGHSFAAASAARRRLHPELDAARRAQRETFAEIDDHHLVGTVSRMASFETISMYCFMLRVSHDSIVDKTKDAFADMATLDWSWSTGSGESAITVMDEAVEFRKARAPVSSSADLPQEHRSSLAKLCTTITAVVNKIAAEVKLDRSQARDLAETCLRFACTCEGAWRRSHVEEMTAVMPDATALLLGLLPTPPDLIGHRKTVNLLKRHLPRIATAKRQYLREVWYSR